jgi:lipopolysaccharide biosynthesis protein
MRPRRARFMRNLVAAAPRRPVPVEAERAAGSHVLVIAHVYYPELWDELAVGIARIPGQVDLVVYSLASPRRTHPVTGITHKSTLKPIGKRVEERTKGGLRMEVFHSAQLGKEEDIIEQIRQGANIGQNTDSATPLAWTHAEYLKLLRSLADGKVWDRYEPVESRYAR